MRQKERRLGRRAGLVGLQTLLRGHLPSEKSLLTTLRLNSLSSKHVLEPQKWFSSRYWGNHLLLCAMFSPTTERKGNSTILLNFSPQLFSSPPRVSKNQPDFCFAKSTSSKEKRNHFQYSRHFSEGNAFIKTSVMTPARSNYQLLSMPF